MILNINMTDIFGQPKKIPQNKATDIFGQSRIYPPPINMEEVKHPPPGNIGVNQELRDQIEEQLITPQYIIKNKPSVSIVRNFFKDNLDSITTEEDILFGPR